MTSCDAAGVEPLRRRLETSLRAAMKDRESAAVGALRAALGAIDNAEAVPLPDGPATAPTTGPIAGARDGAGAGDVAPRELSEADVTAIVRAEIDDLRSSADEYVALGRDQQAAQLRVQADLLEGHLSATSPAPARVPGTGRGPRHGAGGLPANKA